MKGGAGVQPGASSRTWYQYLLIWRPSCSQTVSVGFVGTISGTRPGGHITLAPPRGNGWQSPAGPFGGLAMIVGTLETSVIALVIAVVTVWARQFHRVSHSAIDSAISWRRFRGTVASVRVGLMDCGDSSFSAWMLKTVIPWLDSCLREGTVRERRPARWPIAPCLRRSCLG